MLNKICQLLEGRFDRLMSDTFQKICLISFLIYHLDVLVSGYLSEVSPIKVSKDKKRRYSNFSIQNDDTLHWGVCFSSEKHRLFNDTINDSSHSGTEIKRFHSSDNNNDIIVNDFSSVKKTEFNLKGNNYNQNFLQLNRWSMNVLQMVWWM